MRTILKAARLFDGVAPATIPDAVVVVEGERITRAGPAAAMSVEPAPGADTVIEVLDGTILPGFIEMHTHMHCSAAPHALHDVLTDSDATALLRAGAAMRELVNAGVTTARDIGSKNAVAFAVRDAVRRGIILGPRLLVSGAPITTTGGHFYFMGCEADTVEEVIAAFRAQIKAGADLVKMMVSGGGFTPGTNTRRSQYRPEHVQAAVAEKRRLHRQLVAHCHATESIAYAAEAGVDTIVHCSWQTEDGMRVDERALGQIIDKGIYVDPTLAVGYRRGTRPAAPAGSGTAAEGAAQPELDSWRVTREQRIEVFRRMWDRGARFVVGTDSGMPDTPFGDWALSPELMVRELSMAPRDAILAGTRVAAEALGLAAEIGTVEGGKLADLTVVRGDPLADIRALYRVDTVLLRGRVVKCGGALRV
jgi:imidazolonepropionase-like amidohydrolase